MGEHHLHTGALSVWVHYLQIGALCVLGSTVCAWKSHMSIEPCLHRGAPLPWGSTVCAGALPARGSTVRLSACALASALSWVVMGGRDGIPRLPVQTHSWLSWEEVQSRKLRACRSLRPPRLNALTTANTLLWSARARLPACRRSSLQKEQPQPPSWPRPTASPALTVGSCDMSRMKPGESHQAEVVAEGAALECPEARPPTQADPEPSRALPRRSASPLSYTGSGLEDREEGLGTHTAHRAPQASGLVRHGQRSR